MSILRRSALCAASSLTLAALLAAPALAQTAPAAVQAEDDTRLSEVIVTAQKRSESLQDVPISVTALGAQAIDRSAIRTAKDLTLIAPTLTYTSGAMPSFSTFAIRGVGSYVYRIGIQPAVSVVVDGIPFARTAEYGQDLGDIERVEVLNGPQGTLFGRNATGGAVNIVRKGPTTEPGGYLAADVLVGHHSDQEFFVRGAANMVLSDQARLRVYGFKRYNSDYIDNYHPTATDIGKNNSYGVQMKGVFDVTDRLSVTLSGDASYLYSRLGDPQILQELQAYQVPTVPNISAKEIALQKGAIGQRWASNTFKPYQTHLNIKGVSADITYELSDNLSLKSLTAYRTNRLRAFTAQFNVAASILDPQGFDMLTSVLDAPIIMRDSNYTRATDWKYVSQELRLQYETERLTVLAGGYYSDLIEKELNNNPSYFSAQRVGPAGLALVGTPAGPTAAFPYFYNNAYTNAADRTQVLAGFVDVTVRPTDRLTVFAGYRYSHDTINFRYQRLAYVNVPVRLGVNFDVATVQPLIPPGAARDFAGSDSDNNWAGRVGGSYEVLDNVNVYGTFSRGYVGSGFDAGGNSKGTTADPNSALLLPSITNNYEAGIKSELLDRRLRLNLAIFNTKTRNVQVSALIAGTSVAVVQNAGDIRARGVDLSAEAQISSAFNVVANVAYLDSEFQNLRQPCYPNQANIPGAGCVGGTQDVSGLPAVNAPRWKLSISPTYQIDLPNAPFNMYLRGDYTYSSSVYFQLDHDPLARGDGYAIINLGVGFTDKNDRYEARIFVNNLTDKFYCQNLVNGPVSRQQCQSTPITAQRRFGASITANF